MLKSRIVWKKILSKIRGGRGEGLFMTMSLLSLTLLGIVLISSILGRILRLFGTIGHLM